MKLIVMCLLSMPLMAMAQVQITSATYNQDTRDIHITGNIDPAIQALVFTTIKTIEAHGGGTVTRTEWLRATVEGYPYWHPSVKILDGSSHFDLKYTLRNYTLSADSVTPGVYFGEGDFASPLGETFTNVVQMCPPKDWTIGAPTTTQCMPEADRTVLEQSEFGSIPGVGSEKLINIPESWCRYDAAYDQRMYWPLPSSENCTPELEQQTISTAISIGQTDWTLLGCYPPDRIIVMQVDFTPIGRSFLGGAGTPFFGHGHILIDTALEQEHPEASSGSVLHEITHTVQKQLGYTDVDMSFQTWPESIAVAAMIRGLPGSSYFVDAHTGWPNNWTGGLTYGRDRARHAGLFIRFLEENPSISLNACTFMRDHKALLSAGDEIGAFEAAVSQFRFHFSLFVANYNMRRGTEELEILAQFSPAVQFPVATTAPNSVAGVANGMTDGQTIRIPDTGFHRYSLGMEASPRCVNHQVIMVTHDSGPRRSFDFVETGQYKATGSRLWGDGDLFITMASPEGDVHMRELVFTGLLAPNIPSDPWPPQDTNDPWQVESCQ